MQVQPYLFFEGRCEEALEFSAARRWMLRWTC
jgi:uncharacterized glyoxalase superfamily protein PhnB